MKRADRYKIPIIVIIIIIAIIIGQQYSKTHINNSNNKLAGESLDEEKCNIGSDFEINEINIFETTYEELIDIMGKPQKITNIDDEILIINSGYFSVLSYEGVEFTINSNDSFDLTKGIVVEIDIVGANVSTQKGITINDTKNKVKKEYSINKVYNLEADKEYPVISVNKIKGLRRNNLEINISEYDEFCYIQNKEKPTALIFLFKDNKVKRIIVRHLTAG